MGAPDAGSGFVRSALTPTGNGYWLATAGRKVQNFGDAAALGSTPMPAKPVVGLASLG